MSEVVREFTDEGHPGPRGENKILYDDFVDMLVVASPRFRILLYWRVMDSRLRAVSILFP